MKDNTKYNRIHRKSQNGSHHRTPDEAEAEAWKYEFLRRKARLFPKPRIR